MHPQIKHHLRQIADFEVETVGDKSHLDDRYSYTNLYLQNTEADRVIAHRVYEALRNANIVAGEKAQLSFDQLKQPLPIHLSEKARIINNTDPNFLTLQLDFGSQNGKQVGHAIHKALNEQAALEMRPSRYEALTQPFTELARAAGITLLEPIQMLGDEMVIKTKVIEGPHGQRWLNFSNALSTVDLTSQNSLDTMSIASFLDNEGTFLVHVPLGTYTPEQVKAKLHEASEHVGDILKTPDWQGRVRKGAFFIDNTEQRRQ